MGTLTKTCPHVNIYEATLSKTYPPSTIYEATLSKTHPPSTISEGTLSKTCPRATHFYSPWRDRQHQTWRRRLALCRGLVGPDHPCSRPNQDHTEPLCTASLQHPSWITSIPGKVSATQNQQEDFYCCGITFVQIMTFSRKGFVIFASQSCS